MDVNELFETQIPIGPEHRPMTERIAIGRRALRRRRAASMGAASVAVVAVVGIIGAVVNVGDLRSDRDNPPASSTSSPTASATYTPPPPDEELTNAIPVGRDFGECVADYDPASGAAEVPCVDDMLSMGRAGVIRRREGVQISQRVDDPFDDPEVTFAVALEATYKGVTRWVFLSQGPGGGHLQTTPGEITRGQTFEEWAAELTPVTDAEHRYPEFKDAEGVTRVGIAWYDRFELVIREDAEVVERIDNPLGYADKDGSVALAARVDGVEWWTLLTGPPAYDFNLQKAGSGNFQAWVDQAVREASFGSAGGFKFDKNGRVVNIDDSIKIVDQIVDPDIDWLTEPGQDSALVEYTGRGEGPSFILLRAPKGGIEGAAEDISFRYHPEKDTLQTILARLQKENRS